MTKTQAIQAMREGRKVTHYYFSPEEWVKENCHLYQFEDGCLSSPEEFWRHRQGPEWGENWEIW